MENAGVFEVGCQIVSEGILKLGVSFSVRQNLRNSDVIIYLAVFGDRLAEAPVFLLN